MEVYLYRDEARFSYDIFIVKFLYSAFVHSLHIDFIPSFFVLSLLKSLIDFWILQLEQIFKSCVIGSINYEWISDKCFLDFRCL
jgi:hypothetical protein